VRAEKHEPHTQVETFANTAALRRAGQEPRRGINMANEDEFAALFRCFALWRTGSLAAQVAVRA
jgi:hypothetical protein